MIHIPRTRTGNFRPSTIELLKYQQEQINSLSLLLYQKGLTTRDISSIFEEFFGENMSPSKVSNLAEAFNEARKAWEQSKLEAHYKVIFCDAMYIEKRR